MTTNFESNLDDATALYAVARAIHAGAPERLVHAIADCHLSLNKLKLLHILARPHKRAPRIARVAQLLGISSTMAAVLVRELDDDRLVDRIDDERDGRSKRVVITPRGREILGQLERQGIGDVERFLATLTAGQRRLLMRAVDELVKRPEIAELRA
jgi:DNA-binding MarR family transcriptional regulator